MQRLKTRCRREELCRWGSDLQVLSIRTCVTPCIRTSVTLCLQDLLEGAQLGPLLPAARPLNTIIVSDDRSPHRAVSDFLPANFRPVPPRQLFVRVAPDYLTIV